MAGTQLDRLRGQQHEQQQARTQALQELLGTGWWEWSTNLQQMQLAPQLGTRLLSMQELLTRDAWLALFHPVDRDELNYRFNELREHGKTLLFCARLHLQKVAPIQFQIVAVNMDQKQPGFPEDVLPAYLKSLGVEYHIVEKDTYSLVKELIPEGKTTCSLCSRLRRGTLYTFADQIGATKMALGHHRDDIVETFFLNMFFNGTLKAMPPKLRSDDGRNVVIRPLAYCNEKDIQAYSDWQKFPIIPCNLCGSQENLQRQVVKDMLQEWDRKTPGRTESIFRSLQNVNLSQLADRNLFDFASLKIDDTAASRFVNLLNL